MANPNTHFAVVLALILTGIMSTTALAHGQYYPSPSCGGLKECLKRRCTDMFDFLKDCALYMHKFSPTFHKPDETCCASARKINIVFFCQMFLIKQTELVFSPKKVAIIAKQCGKPLPLSTTCGSFTVGHNKSRITQTRDSLKELYAANMTSLE